MESTLSLVYMYIKNLFLPFWQYKDAKLWQKYFFQDHSLCKRFHGSNTVLEVWTDSAAEIFSLMN